MTRRDQEAFTKEISEFCISKCQFSTNKSRIKDNSHSNNLGRSEKEMEDEVRIGEEARRARPGLPSVLRPHGRVSPTSAGQGHPTWTGCPPAGQTSGSPQGRTGQVQPGQVPGRPDGR